MGLAYAAQYRADPAVVMVFFGDGATSEGDFHEALNFAGVWQVPVVFVCQNNQWAISVPLKKQTHSRTLAGKALAYGFPGIQVDGNDVLAVVAASREAVERARAGGGPTLIECVTYRLGVHTTADDPTRYRSAEELAAWERKDPLTRFTAYLRDARTCSMRGWSRRSTRRSRRPSNASRRRRPPIPSGMFDHAYGQLPPDSSASARRWRSGSVTASGRLPPEGLPSPPMRGQRSRGR